MNYEPNKFELVELEFKHACFNWNVESQHCLEFIRNVVYEDSPENSYE